MNNIQTSGQLKFKKYKFVILILVFLIKLFPKFLRVLLWDLILNYSQIFFIVIRYVIIKSMIKSCGDNVRVGENVRIINWDNLEIGNNVSIHTNSYIDAYGGIYIGSNVSIAHHCSIVSTNHKWDNDLIPIKYNNVSCNPVFIDDDVWIGAGCRILSGSKIEKRSILAAGAVLNTNVPMNSIYGGIPAKLIKFI